MPKELQGLSTEEQQLMFDAIPLITILVAGADGNMDENEIEWAKKLTDIRSFEFKNEMQAYYTKVSEQFSDRLAHFDSTLPKETAARMAATSELLSGLNAILHKMDTFDAAHHYKNLRSFATHVAKASGGVLGIMAIGSAEAEVVDLPMIEEFKL